MHSLSLIYYQISYEDKGGWYIVLGLIFLPSFMWQSTLPNKECISVQAAKLFTCSSKPDFSKQAIICWLSFIIMKPHKKKNKKKKHRKNNYSYTVIVHCVSNLQSLFNLFMVVCCYCCCSQSKSLTEMVHTACGFRAMATNPLKTCSVSHSLCIVSSACVIFSADNCL